MKKNIIHDVLLNPLKIINVPKGNVMHAMKLNDDGYNNFGEAYFSTIQSGCVKGWKKHTKMTCNLVVVTGEIEFIIHDFKDEDQTIIESNNFLLNQDDYKKLTIPPCLWFAFKGIAKKNIVLNITDMMHDDAEVLGQEVDYDIFPSLRL